MKTNTKKNKDPLSDVDDRSISKAILDYIEEKQGLGTLSKTSAYNRTLELNRFEKFCAKHGVNTVALMHKNLMVQYLTSLKVNQNTKNTAKNVLTAFGHYLVDEGLILENDASLIKMPKTRQVPMDVLTNKEIDLLFQTEAQSGSKTTIDRNLLLFSLLLNLCLRASEVTEIQLSDLQIDNGNNSLYVKRKGGKQKELPVNEDLRELFVTWLAWREENKGVDSPYLFLSTHGNKLDRKQIHWIVQKALQRAGIVKRKKGPHLLRHTGASILAADKVNPAIIQNLLDHENLSSTQKYLHFSKEDLVKAVNQIGVRKKKR
jgi:integrase/recombinase XerC